MSRYIDADALQKLFNEVSTSLLCRRELAKDTEHMVRAFIMVTEMIQDAPTVDAVEAVRCRDCKHCRNLPNGLCYLHTEPCANERGYKGEAVCVEPDDFCSYGGKT